MAEFRIRGGKRLTGEIEVRGAKNSALKAMAASLLFSGPVTIKNIPLIEDVFRMNELLEDLGVSTKKLGERVLRIDPRPLAKSIVRRDIAEQLRASIVLAGPLLGASGKAIFPHPGGCVIGKRPIDMFLEGWRAMGAKVRVSRNSYEINAPRLRGIDFTFRKVSVTGTETLMMTAVLAKGKTILRNAAMEPEIPNLADFLIKSGAVIKGAGGPTIEIIGRGKHLLKGGGIFETIPDRIEAGSFLILGAALGDHLEIKNANPEHLASLLAALKAAGVNVAIRSRTIRVSRPRRLFASDIKTREYPGFVTDLQAPFAVLMTQAEGESLIFETVFDGRLNYIEELNRMGARITPCDPHRILIHGPTPLRGREIESPDIRAGLAFLIAALAAKGESRIKNVYQIDRGYERIEERLAERGADIKRIES